MAKTSYATNNALTQKLWEEALFRDTVKESFFGPMMGKGYDKLCHTDEKLTKEQGDSVTFGIRMRLSGAGVTSGQTLEGNEEALQTHDFSVTLEEYAHAVRDRGPLDRQRPIYKMDEHSRMALKDWMSEKIDQLCFDTITVAPTTYFYSTTSGTPLATATAATAKAALTAADSKITPSLISALKAYALTGGNRAQTPLRGVKVDGREAFVLLVHPDVKYDIMQNSTFTQALREAEVRGPKNPLFNGSFAIWDNVAIKEHENIPIATDAGAGGDVPWAKCVFMGAQSLVWAWGARPKVVAEEFDYGREHGFAISMMAGLGAPKFNSKTYGSLGLYVARTKISDL